MPKLCVVKRLHNIKGNIQVVGILFPARTKVGIVVEVMTKYMLTGIHVTSRI